MATSGTFTFNLDIADVIEEAYELAGWELRSGYDAQTARRSINLVLSDWTNRGVNLWTIDQQTQALVQGTADYTLDTSTVDILQAILRDSNSLDTSMDRITIEAYLNFPDKSIEGRSTQWALRRGISAPTISLFPAPRNSTDTFVYWRFRYIEDASLSNQDPDVPKRFLPALTTALAYQLSLKKPTNSLEPEAVKADAAKRRELRGLSIDMFEAARGEDRDRSSLFLIPKMRRR